MCIQSKAMLRSYKDGPPPKPLVLIERISSESCLLKLPYEEEVTGVEMKIDSGDWCELQNSEYSQPFPAWLVVKKTFQESKEYCFKCLFGDGGRFYKSANLLFDADNHLSVSRNCGIISHADGTPVLRASKAMDVCGEVKYKVSSGGSSVAMVKEREEWFKLCDYFVYRYYGLMELVQIPFTLHRTSAISNVVKVMVELCKAKKNKPPGYVITHYDVKNHCEFLGYDLEQLSAKLGIHFTEDVKNRVLAYAPAENVIFNLRVLQVNDSVAIHEGMKVCCNDVKLLLFANEKKFYESQVVIIGLVVVPELSQESKNNPILCKKCYETKLIVSQKEFTDGKVFKKWWKKFLPQVFKLKNAFKADSAQNLSLLSNIIGFMATKKVYLPITEFPSLSEDVQEQMKTILLTPEQQELLNLKDKKVILFGSFGSGKSIMAHLKIRQLIIEAAEPTFIFYVCFENDSLFQCKVKEFLEKDEKNANLTNKNAKIEVLDLSKLSAEHKAKMTVSLILTDTFSKYQNGCLHFFFDEYNGEDLDENEASDIQTILRGEELPRIKDSVVWLISQSIEKHRNYCEKRSNAVVNHGKNQFRLTGMKKVTLHKTLRATNAINEVVKVCIERIEKSPNEFPHRVTPARVTVNRKPTLDEKELTISDTTRSSKQEISPSDDRRLQLEEHSIRPDEEESSLGSVCMELDQSVDLEFQRQNEDQDVDQCFKLIYDANSKEQCNEVTRTEFHFHGGNAIGHNIGGSKPTYMNISNIWNLVPEACTDLESKYYSCSICIAMVLEKMHGACNSFLEGITVLCSDAHAVNIMEGVATLLDEEFIRYTPSLDSDSSNKIKEDILDMQQSEGCVLLTDCKGFRGMETEKMIVFVDQSDTFLKQNLVEALGRCTNDLMIIQYNPPNLPITTDETVAEIVKEWKSQDLVRIIELRKCGCYLKEKELCDLDLECDIYGFHYGEWYEEEKQQLRNHESLKDEEYDVEELRQALERTLIDPYQKSASASVEDATPTTPNEAKEEGLSSVRIKYVSVENNLVGAILGPGGARIATLAKRFNVQLRIIERTEIEIRGRDNDIARIEQWLSELKRRKNDGSLENASEIESFFYDDYLSKGWLDDGLQWASLDFLPDKYFGQVIGKKGSNKARLNKEFAINLVVDKRINKLLVKGTLESKRQVKGYVKYFLYRLENYWETQLQSLKEMCLLGLGDSDIVEMVQKRNCKKCCQHCEIKVLEKPRNMKKVFDNMPKVYETIKNVLIDIKSRLSKAEQAVCCVMIHHGRLHHSSEPGYWPVKDISNNSKISFERLKSFTEFNDYSLISTVVRFDLRIVTPEPVVEIRYKVFCNPQEKSFITCEEAGANSKRFYKFRVGPGYVCIQEHLVLKTDIINPVTNYSTRVNVQTFKPDKEKENIISIHVEALKDFFKNIKLSSEPAMTIVYGKLPEDYFICYKRRSERKSYHIPPSTLLRTSDEFTSVKDGLSCGIRDKDMFLNLQVLDAENWEVEQVLEGLQEAFQCSDVILSSLGVESS
ncbi:uncharacterized protein LOC130653583 isoform X2 [Hydractinia symbiolongicarpus]|uniref:uncharacterized protein LOC130653583 isoform X2 n=1 Tax=Hydractinia symbiolongicarpus TaxID=13093 RepID=UPI0025506071|nr:uncharacterized protein LOC130653583 isoform X2 [Hydractinia symbiolongicarpus]